MKRTTAIKRLRKAAKTAGLEFEITEGTRHTKIRIGNTTSLLARHAEINDRTVRAIFDQYAPELGKGWWR